MREAEMGVMLDLETMGNGADAAIVAIGAVKFSRDRVYTDSANTFYATVDLQSSIDAGGVVDGETVYWWLQQSYEARKSLLSAERASITLAVTSFAEWFPRGSTLWGNGCDFDNPILQSAFRQVYGIGVDYPWKYNAGRDMRTLKALANTYLGDAAPDQRAYGVKHNALDDAISQAQYVVACYSAFHTLVRV